jgi:hypothetical protein
LTIYGANKSRSVGGNYPLAILLLSVIARLAASGSLATVDARHSKSPAPIAHAMHATNASAHHNQSPAKSGNASKRATVAMIAMNSAPSEKSGIRNFMKRPSA